MNVWISATELAALPMSGTAWTSVASKVNVATSGASVSNMDSNHDIDTLGCALYAVRRGDATAKARATAALTSVIGTESGRWLEVCRNLGAYIVAADILDIRSGPIYDWLKRFDTRTLQHNNDASRQIKLRDTAWQTGSNADTHAGWVHAALNAYIGDQAELDWGWTWFRRYLGDRNPGLPANASTYSNDLSWQQNTAYPVGIQNKGALKGSVNIDGADSNDMSRGGSVSSTPGLTSYPWVGLEGAYPAAIVYWRRGLPAFELMDSALKRAATYLWNLRVQNGAWYDAARSKEIKRLINWAYGLTYTEAPTGGLGRTISFTDWTHAGTRPASVPVPTPTPTPVPLTVQQQLDDHERRIKVLEARP